jgi:hypothetical protein
MRHIVFIFALNLILHDTHAQKSVDTICIYQDSAGMPFTKYKHIWFDTYKSFSYCPRTKQDSFVANDTARYYVKYYGKTNNLAFEGLNSGYDHYLCGEIKFYYGDGTLNHTEIWEEGKKFTDTCSHKSYFFDGMVPGGTWKYFYKSGTLKYELEFPFFSSCEGTYPKIVTRITYYRKDGTISKMKYRRCKYY